MADNDTNSRDIKTRIFGKRVGGTVIQLVVASIIVGALFSFLGLGPRAFWHGIFDSVSKALGVIGDNVGDVIMTLGAYFFIGAAIVAPIWLIVRLFSGRR